MNNPTIIFILSIISYMNGNVMNCQTGQPDNTRLIDLDWTGKNTEECKTYIQNTIEMTNNQGDPFFKPINDLCLPDNRVLSIDVLCSDTLQTTQSILRGFFFLDRGLQEPENQIYKENQCTCQNKCNIQESSPYTFKITHENNVGYFTTKNSCMAFCMNGYEIYPTSYIVNTFPDPSAANVVLKKGLDECNMHLNHTIPKFKQIAIMHAEFCHAFALCEKFKEIYNADILFAETCIYGSNFNDDHILSDEEKFWIGQSDENLQTVSTRCLHFNIPQNSSSTLTEAESCFNVFANNNISIEERNETHCFSKQLSFDGVNNGSHIVNICEDDQDPIGTDTTVNLFKKFFIVNTLLIQCLMGESNPVPNAQSDITGCICQDPFPSVVEKFDTSCIDLFFIENGISSFNLQNNFSFFNIINTESPHVSFDSTGACSCPFLNFFDYLAFQESCALCFINGRNRTFEVLNTSERFLFLQSQHISSPSLITNQTKEECESQNGFNGDDVNSACIDGNDICLLKKIKDPSNNNFQALFTKQNESLQCILNQLNDVELSNNNVIFDCPLNENCSDLTCSIEYVEKCKADTNFSQFCEDFVNNSCGVCDINNISLNTCVIHNNQAFLFSEYDACSLDCINPNIKLCKENENCLHLTNDENIKCQEIFSISQCETECQSLNNTNLYCSFNSSVVEDCISEINGCLEICNGNNERVLCSAPDLSCFQSYCSDFISTNPSCKCLDCVNPTLEFCKVYDSDLTCDDYCTNMFCTKTSTTNEILYDLIEITYICDNNPSLDNINLKQCANCLTTDECCEEFCDFSEAMCAIIDGLAIYADEQILCNASCSNKTISFPSNNTSCCEDLCNNHFQDFCLANNDNVIFFTPDTDCSKICAETDFNSYEITNDDNKCKTCEEKCINEDDSEEIYCSFDEDINKICISAKENCLKNCNNELNEVVRCEETNEGEDNFEYSCLVNFCNDFNKSFCDCLECDNTSLDLCKAYIPNCNCNDCLDVIYCKQKTLNDIVSYERFTNLECCGSNSPEETNDIKIESCITCNDTSDCCEHFCNFTEDKCTRIDLGYKFYKSHEICEQSCDESISFEIQDKIEPCCEDICTNHSNTLCYFANNKYSLFDTQNCEDICNDLKNTNDFKITDNYSLCTNTMTCEELAETKPDGKYCNRNFDVFDSFLNYCNSVNGMIDEFDYVLCTKAKCNKRQCKKLFFDKACKNDDKKQLSVVGEHGECLFFDNREDLEDEFTDVIPDWKIFECKYSCEQKCLQSIEYKSFYISHYIPKCDEEKAYYCYRKKIISSIEYAFYRKCLQKPDDYFKKCDDYRCKNTRCKIYDISSRDTSSRDTSSRDTSSRDTSHESDENTISDNRFIWNSNMNLICSVSIPKNKRKKFIKFEDYQNVLRKRKHKQNKQISQNIISITLQHYGCYSFNGKRYVKKIRKDYCLDTKFLSLCAEMNVSSFKECKEECQKLV